MSIDKLFKKLPKMATAMEGLKSGVQNLTQSIQQNKAAEKKEEVIPLSFANTGKTNEKSYGDMTENEINSVLDIMEAAKEATPEIVTYEDTKAKTIKSETTYTPKSGSVTIERGDLKDNKYVDKLLDHYGIDVKDTDGDGKLDTNASYSVLHAVATPLGISPSEVESHIVAKALKDGSVTLDTPEVKVSTTNNEDPLKNWKYDKKEGHLYSKNDESIVPEEGMTAEDIYALYDNAKGNEAIIAAQVAAQNGWKDISEVENLAAGDKFSTKDVSVVIDDKPKTEYVVNTVTDTVTDTVMNTITNTKTDTVVNTVTATKTDTVMNTVTDTVTNTKVNTVVNTVTDTVVNTVTATKTDTIMNTVTNTVTNTKVNTVINTVTDTVVNTVTNTKTDTVVNTVTKTVEGKPVTEFVTNYITNTVTNTKTDTVLNTVTATKTDTVVNTVVNTVTDTVVNTVTNTVTDTVVRTETVYCEQNVGLGGIGGRE